MDYLNPKEGDTCNVDGITATITNVVQDSYMLEFTEGATQVQKDAVMCHIQKQAEIALVPYMQLQTAINKAYAKKGAQ